MSHIGYSEFSEYLLNNKFASAEALQAAIHPQERAELVFTSLKKAEAEEKLLLLDFEWTMLPLEQIKITCVSAREEKHFTYGF
jgi:hypothetical protein